MPYAIRTATKMIYSFFGRKVIFQNQYIYLATVKIFIYPVFSDIKKIQERQKVLMNLLNEKGGAN